MEEKVLTIFGYAIGEKWVVIKAPHETIAGTCIPLECSH